MDGPKYVAPSFKAVSFNCPYCGAYSRMRWSSLNLMVGAGFKASGWHVSVGDCCDQKAYWMESGVIPVKDAFIPQGVLMYPASKTSPMPARDMPDDVRADYMEARDIVSSSPRSAAALLRLAIQKLCVHLGETGENLNADIGNLVKKGLPAQAQQALDVVRVVGNNSVHPGELSPDDVANVADKLFALTNFIVQNQITQPAEVAALFGGLPDGAKAAVAKRDAPKGD